MEVIAKTSGAFLIEATENELREILNAVTGSKPEKIIIGQKIPAIDYAGTIRKIKALKENSDFKNLNNYSNKVYETIKEFHSIVEQASKIEI